MEDKDTFVAPSTLGKHAGLGLFAGRGFKRGETICDYSGRLVSTGTILTDEQRRYTLQLSRKWSIDASDPSLSSMGRYVNDCRASDMKRLQLSRGSNARFSCNHHTKRVKIVATYPIGDKQEIFVSYGSDYWRGR